MTVEDNYSSLYKKYSKLHPSQIDEKIADIEDEMSQLGNGNFSTLNDSSNNLKYSVLIQIREEKTSKSGRIASWSRNSTLQSHFLIQTYNS